MSKKTDMEKMVRVPFRHRFTLAFSASAQTQTVGTANLTAANMGARVAGIAPSFEFFRIASCRIYAHSDAAFLTYDTNGTTKVGIVNGFFAIAYDPEVLSGTTTPTTVDQLGQFAHFDQGNVRQKLRISLKPRDMYLSTPFRWFHTTATGTFGADSLSAGAVYIGTFNDISTASPPSVRVVIEGMVEFKGLVTPALSFGGQGKLLGVVPTETSVTSSATLVEEKEEDDDDTETVIVSKHRRMRPDGFEENFRKPRAGKPV
jgi:hypothetical protein